MGYNIICAGGTDANTGVGSCRPDWNDTIGMILLPKGQEIDITTLTATSVSSLLAKVIDGTVKPLPRMTFDSKSTVETQTKELAGKMQYIKEGERRAKYVLVDIFGCVQKNLRLLNNGVWTAIIFDSTGKFLGREGSTTAKIKGINLSQIYFTQMDPMGVAYGETDQQAMYVTIDPMEFESEMAYGTLGYPYDDIQGIVNVTVTKVSATTSEIVVDVVESCNDSGAVTGLLQANFAVSQGGSSCTITGVTESSEVVGRYTIATTITANPFVLSIVPTATAMYKVVQTIAYA